MRRTFCCALTLVLTATLVAYAGNAAPQPAEAAAPAAASCVSRVGPGIPPPARVAGGLPGFHAAWYGQSGYLSLCPGERTTSVVAFKNSGSYGWLQGRMGEAAYLGTWQSDSAQDHASVLGGDGTLGSPDTGWPNYDRLATQPTAYVGPVQVAWFQFSVQAPAAPGTYRLGIRPLIEGASWLEDYGVFWQVTVLNPDGTAPRAVTLPSSTGAVAGTTTAPAPSATGFVSRSGTRLALNGQPYRFTGLNIYNANSRNNCWYTMGSGAALDSSLNSIGAGQEVFRSWFFQSLATTGGQRDWSAFDHTLAVAAAHGQRVIATLGDQWGACEQPGAPSVYKTEAWYRSGYQTTPMNPAVTRSYRDWVAEVATRYRGNPTILAWQLMNEAEDQVSHGGACGSAASLKTWADDVAGVIKQADPNHLVSLGTMGGGQCGTQGADYQLVHSGPNIDLCEYHDYGHPGSPMPGDQWNGLAVRLQQCAALGKPLFVGEIGLLPADTGGSLAQRAAEFDAKFSAQLSAGAVGALLWAWNNGSVPITTYDIGAADPALAVMAKY
jgi:mannan endo-1,4-beta-mannosidase